jgi:tripartite-type tricarboxylate transporter receptor subunit TctC
MGEMMLRAALTASFVLIASAATAQDFPSKTIRIVVGFPAGGPSDVPARLIAEKLRLATGQSVIVENKTGAAGMIALADVLAQPRDGHTLLLCSYIDAINPLLYKKVSYKLDDIAPVSLVQKAYYAFTISNALPVNDLKGFIAHAKAKPGALNYGKVGSGSVTELLAKQLEKVAGISMTGVTFRGTGPAVQEIAAERLDFMVGPLAVTIPLHEAKKVKIIGMTSPERLPIAPDVPTLREQGTEIVNYGWWGVCAHPEGDPRDAEPACGGGGGIERVQKRDREDRRHSALVLGRRVRRDHRRHREGGGRDDQGAGHRAAGLISGPRGRAE